jgi:hypothetical protein
MTSNESKKIPIKRYLFLIALTFQISSCIAQEQLKQTTTFPQIHTNLNGMVREFVRSMLETASLTGEKGKSCLGTYAIFILSRLLM